MRLIVASTPISSARAASPLAAPSVVVDVFSQASPVGAQAIAAAGKPFSELLPEAQVALLSEALENPAEPMDVESGTASE